MNLDLSPLAEMIVKKLRESTEARVVEAKTSLDPIKPYTTEQAGKYLGLSANRVYEIPECELPRLRNGGRVRILGINLMLYAMGQPPIDTEALAQSVRERFLAEHGDVPRPVRRIAAAASAASTTPQRASVRTRTRVH